MAQIERLFYLQHYGLGCFLLIIVALCSKHTWLIKTTEKLSLFSTVLLQTNFFLFSNTMLFQLFHTELLLLSKTVLSQLFTNFPHWTLTTSTSLLLAAFPVI